MKKLSFLLLLGLFIAACGDTAEEGKSLQTVKTDSRIQSIIRNPVSMNGTEDTTNVAKMTFEEMSWDFGEIKEGDVVSHEYAFTNTGKVPLIITHAKSTCGCTIPDYPKEPIEPGQSGKIKVQFNSKGKRDMIKKPVTITANTFPSKTELKLSGFVHSNNNPVSVDQ